MAINLQKHCDNRGLAGYGAALLYRDIKAGDKKYHLLYAGEGVPSVNGSVDTFEYDILTCISKSQVEGKETLDQKDTEFLWHRDNVKRLEKLQGRVIDFLAVYPDFTGREFKASIKVRPNDVTNDLVRGTLTFTPIWASTETLDDVSDIIQDTLAFATPTPSKVEVSTTKPLEMECKLVQEADTCTITAKSNSDDIATAEISGGKLTITGKIAGKSAIITLTASDSDTSENKCASWVETIRVVVE